MKRVITIVIGIIVATISFVTLAVVVGVAFIIIALDEWSRERSIRWLVYPGI